MRNGFVTLFTSAAGVWALSTANVGTGKLINVRLYFWCY
jgi:hypothetical protein